MDAMAMLRWLANTVHQAYHLDSPGAWSECHKDLCKSVVNFVQEADKEGSPVEKALQEQRKSLYDKVKHLRKSLGTQRWWTDESTTAAVDIVLSEVLDIIETTE